MTAMTTSARGSGLGIFALLLAIASGIMSFIPPTSGWAILTSFIALILGIVAAATGRGVVAGVIAIILAVISGVLAVVFAIIYGFFGLLFG